VPDPDADRDDRDLIAAIAAGDRASFTALVLRHRAAVHRVARALTATDADADDVVQDAFLGALRGADGYRGQATVRAWLFAITRHAAFRRARRADQVPHEPATLDRLGADAGWGQPDVEAAAALAEDRRLLARALASLPLEEREVIVLRDVEGLSGEEAAAALGVGVAAMKSRLHRGRLRLAAALRAEGGLDDRRS
jgi:RNA polymerase sigma-70 factor (ECF subfamily)